MKDVHFGLISAACAGDNGFRSGEREEEAAGSPCRDNARNKGTSTDIDTHRVHRVPGSAQNGIAYVRPSLVTLAMYAHVFNPDTAVAISLPFLRTGGP